MAARIKPQILKGFRDYLPAQAAARQRIVSAAQQVFESFGFQPLETPLIEYAEVLLGKYGEEGEKQIYRFTDHGGRDVCLRFDLTVPLARFVAMHPELPRPFKRYQIGTVFRGEHPRAGRFREFAQVDIDIVGSRSVTADAEIVAAGTALCDAIGVPDYLVRVNHRGILNALFSMLGVDSPETVNAVFRIVDKIEKVGEAEVRRALAEEVGLSSEAVAQILAFLQIKGDQAVVVQGLRGFFEGRGEVAGLAELGLFLEHLGVYGIPAGRVQVDLSIARGIDYYTGLVFETFLSEKPDFGSIMSGGRYDHLIGLMAGQEVPAVGISMGLDRLVAALEEMGRLPSAGTPARVLVVAFGREGFAPAQRIASELRAAGVNAEVSHEHAKVAAQFKYADRTGIPFVLTQGEDERQRGVVKLKDLAAKSEIETTLPEAIQKLRASP